MHQWWIGSGREWLYRIQVGNVSHGLAKILYLQIDLANNVIAVPTRSEVRKMIKVHRWTQRGHDLLAKWPICLPTCPLVPYTARSSTSQEIFSVPDLFLFTQIKRCQLPRWSRPNRQHNTQLGNVGFTASNHSLATALPRHCLLLQRQH